MIETIFPLFQADGISSKVLVNLELADIPELSLDENQMRQLILNFVRNGIEAMPRGGNMTISTSLQDGKVFLAISDQRRRNYGFRIFQLAGVLTLYH